MSAGYHDWTVGEKVTAANLEDYLQLQTVMRFASSAARDSALTSVKTDVMLVYETDSDRYSHWDGTGWVIIAEPAQAWTPTVSWTAGNGTFAAKYWRGAGWCEFRMSFTFGSTSSIAGSAVLTLPVATAGIPGGAIACQFEDAGTDYYTGLSQEVSAAGTQVTLNVIETAATYARSSLTSGTIPFSFGTGDKIHAAGRFQMNTRYL